MSQDMLFVGTYAKSGGRGLYPLSLEPGGALGVNSASSAAANASFGAYSSRHDVHYLVDEQERGSLVVLRRSDSGWARLAEVATMGSLPCYVALSPSQDHLAIANYGNGVCTLLALDPASGLPQDDPIVRQNRGRGPVEDRQEGPHAHCAVFSPDGLWLYQTDLGADEVRAFAVEHGALDDGRTAWRAPAGAGPRHLVIHPSRPIALLVCELSSTLSVLKVSDGTLTELQTVSTLPRGFEGESLGGHLALNHAGDRAYLTNRGHDSVATFALEGDVLTLLGHEPVGGSSPRFLLLCEDAQTMLVANEEGNSVTRFALRDDGTPARLSEVAVPGPAFIFAAR